MECIIEFKSLGETPRGRRRWPQWLAAQTWKPGSKGEASSGPPPHRPHQCVASFSEPWFTHLSSVVSALRAIDGRDSILRVQGSTCNGGELPTAEGNQAGVGCERAVMVGFPGGPGPVWASRTAPNLPNLTHKAPSGLLARSSQLLR